jgi:hypothetical protein
MIVHLVDGTYELFRHFYGLRRFNKGVDRPYGAVVGVPQRFPFNFSAFQKPPALRRQRASL